MAAAPLRPGPWAPLLGSGVLTGSLQGQGNGDQALEA